MLNTERLLLLLSIAVIIAIIAKKVRLPYTVGLVIAGVGLGMSGWLEGLSLTREMILDVFLPPLVFEAAFFLSWPQLRRNLPAILLLAIGGVLISGLLTAVGMVRLAHWPLGSALVFGSLIAATDPVSVIAMFKDMRIGGRVRLLVEAESLANDAVAFVLFGTAVAFASGQGLSAGEAATRLAIEVLGGLLCGSAVAGAAILLAGRAHDHLVTITLTTIAAYGSYALADHFHASGVLAVMTAGIILNSSGHVGRDGDKDRDEVEAFWEYAAFLANSLVFLLIGASQPRFFERFASQAGLLALAVVLVLAGRAAAVYFLCGTLRWSSLRVKANHQHVLFWGGLRGALALALALSLPESVPMRSQIITITYGVVAFSVIVQGVTMPRLVKRLGLGSKEKPELPEAAAPPG